jgi:hypothetical protein
MQGQKAKAFIEDKWPDLCALLICLGSLICSLLVADKIYENIPHTEDEMAFVWEARVIARGDLKLTSPDCPKCMLVPFVVDYQGLRFGKYPMGWPALLAIGEIFGIRSLINPLLTAWTIWLLYWLFRKIVKPSVALLGIFLTAISPFIWINSGTLLSHPWSLFLTVVLALTWFEVFNPDSKIPRWLTSILCGLAMGVLAITRPLSAIGVTFPFIVYAIIKLIKSDRQIRLRILTIGLVAVAVASLHFLWQYALTGNALLNPYTLWWKYDAIGFGPGIGRQLGGYMPKDIWYNLRMSLHVGASDVYGWFNLSWLFLPFGLISLRKNRKAWLIGSILPSLILAYCFYWVGSWLTGPRYYYEGMVCMSLFTSAGIFWLAGKWQGIKNHGFKNQIANVSNFFVILVVSFLISINLTYYLPKRLTTMKGFYGATYARIAPFKTAEFISKAPALVFVKVRSTWLEYGTLLDISSPYFDSPFVFAIYGSEADNQLVMNQFVDRSAWIYDPVNPDQLISITKK